MQNIKDRVDEIIRRSYRFDTRDCKRCEQNYKNVLDFKGIIKELTDQNTKLVDAIRKTINENLYLADGDNCTLIDLKLVLEELNIKD